eukprot:s5166_g7.t1
MFWAFTFASLAAVQGFTEGGKLDSLDGDSEVPEMLLQLKTEISEVQVALRNDNVSAMPQIHATHWKGNVANLPQVKNGLLGLFGHISKYFVSISYAVLLMICVSLYFHLPSKEPQHPSVHSEGCSRTWTIYLGVVYAFIYASTDQYAPSLPQMEKDLSASQVSMTATIQINWIVKALCGLLAAGLSDRIGRRPVALLCMLLLCLSSFCCASVGQFKWFLAARFLQGMGESFEPVVYAMVRDYYSDFNERIRVSAFLQIMALLGSSIAPFYGGLCAEFLGWRASFFGLSLIWAVLASVGFAQMVECCPDESTESYLKDVARLWDSRLACLLLTESCVMAAYFTFNANCSYLVEGFFHQSIMSAAIIMLVFGVLCSGGAVLSDYLNCGVLQLARIVLSTLALFGVISAALGLFFPDYLWAYLTGAFLQASVMCMALVSAQVLFCEPLADCAGMAASVEVLAQNLLPSVVSALATQSLILDGPRGLGLCQAICCMASGVVFWLGYGWRPPHWATNEAVDNDDVKEGFEGNKEAESIPAKGTGRAPQS